MRSTQILLDKGRNLVENEENLEGAKLFIQAYYCQLRISRNLKKLIEILELVIKAFVTAKEYPSALKYSQIAYDRVVDTKEEYLASMLRLSIVENTIHVKKNKLNRPDYSVLETLVQKSNAYFLFSGYLNESLRSFLWLTRIYKETLQLDRAVHLCKTGIFNAKKINEANTLGELHYELGNIYQLEHRKEDALIAYKTARQYWLTIDNLIDTVSACHQIAEIYLDLGDYSNVRLYLAEASEHSDNIDDFSILVKIALVSILLGIKERNLTEANQLVVDVERIMYRIQDNELRIKSFIVISNLKLIQNSLDTALEYVQYAEELIEEDYSGDYKNEILFQYALIYYLKKNYDIAEEFLKGTIEETAEVFLLLKDTKSRIHFYSKHYEKISLLLRILAERNDIDDLHYLFETSRAKSLKLKFKEQEKHNILQSHWSIEGRVDLKTAIIQIHFTPDRKVLILYITREQKKIRVISLEPLIENYRSDIQDFIAFLKINNSDDIDLKKKQLKKTLTELNPELVDLKRTVEMELYSEQLFMLYNHLINSQSSPELLDSLSNAFYELFFNDEVHSIIENKEEILIMQDGVLLNIPFELFKSKRGSYISKEYKIKYAPSFTIYKYLRAVEYLSHRRPIKVFGVLNYNKDFDSERDLRWSNISSPRYLGRYLLKKFPNGECLHIGDLTKQELIDDLRFNKYKILHFATHGFVVKELPEASALVFQKPSKSSPSESQYLTYDEICKLDIQSDLVFLSACESTVGRNYGGEGMLGLSQAFMIAGARAVISTRWKVNDEATGIFIEEFYKNVFDNGCDFKTSLEKTQNYFREDALMAQKEYNHPYYWSAFKYEGV